MGKVAQVYQARSRRVRPECHRIRGDVGKELVGGLRDATESQLYDVTVLPVTRRMFRSIRARFMGAFDVGVGYDTGVAKYAAIRVAKKGRAKAGGVIRRDMKSNAKEVASRYRTRISRASSEEHRARGEIGSTMLADLRAGYDEQIANVSNLPLTGRMRRSIRLWFRGARNVEVGFDVSKANYAPIRLNMKGVSKTGGHRLDTDLRSYLRKNTFSKIRAIVSRVRQRTWA